VNIGDRIRIKSYEDKDGKTISAMIGLEGTVDLALPDSEFIDTVMDDEIAGTRLWFFHKDELEVI
jgi:hypothetical protein